MDQNNASKASYCCPNGCVNSSNGRPNGRQKHQPFGRTIRTASVYRALDSAFCNALLHAY